MTIDQLQYALDDVLPLIELYERMTERLTKNGRITWAQEEFKQLELVSTYAKLVENEVVSNPIIYSLSHNERIFYLRLMVWRENIAKERNVNKDMIIPAKYIHTLKIEIEKIGYTISDIKHVFISHIHFDHAGAAWKFAEHGASIYVHPICFPAIFFHFKKFYFTQIYNQGLCNF